MSKTQSLATSMTENLEKMTFNNEQGRKMLGEQTERLWRTENDMVSEIENYMQGWCRRRHDAAKAAIEFGDTMSNGADQSDVLEAWNKLSSKAMERLSEDSRAQMEFFQKVAFNIMPNAMSYSGFGLMGNGAANEKKSEKSKDH